MKRYQIETLQVATGEWTRGFLAGHDHQATSRVNAKALARTLCTTCAASKRVVDTVTGEVLCEVLTSEEAERRAVAAIKRVEIGKKNVATECRVTLHVPTGDDVTTAYPISRAALANEQVLGYLAEGKSFSVSFV